jgi:outer membrane lipopolysaccharide assembly protein LptE/RlpB
LSFSRLALLVACLLALASSGCGYALAGRGSFLPAYIHTVAVPQIENRTAFTQVEQIVTEKIRNELIGRGKYQVTTERPGADAVLTGTITRIFVQPVALTSQQQASRYLFTLTMRVQFTDARTAQVLWANESLTFREEYELSTRSNVAIDGGAFLDQERNAFDRIATDVARSVATAILEAF